MAPLDRLPMKRTGSSGSRVPPAVMTTFFPVKRAVRRKISLAVATTDSGLAMRPSPTAPDASVPYSGSTILIPRSLRVVRCPCVAGWCSIRSSIAGATITGAAVESAISPSKSSARPSASLAIAAAVAGATMKRSAFRANPTWPVKSSCHPANASVCTGACVIAENERGWMKWWAASVITTSTRAPACTKRLATVAALKAAMLPVTPRRIDLSSRSVMSARRMLNVITFWPSSA